MSRFGFRNFLGMYCGIFSLFASSNFFSSSNLAWASLEICYARRKRHSISSYDSFRGAGASLESENICFPFNTLCIAFFIYSYYAHIYLSRCGCGFNRNQELLHVACNSQDSSRNQFYIYKSRFSQLSRSPHLDTVFSIIYWQNCGRLRACLRTGLIPLISNCSCIFYTLRTVGVVLIFRHGAECASLLAVVYELCV